MVVTFGAVQGTRWVGRKASVAGVQLELLEGPEDTLHCSYKYMFQRLRDVRNGERNKRTEESACDFIKLQRTELFVLCYSLVFISML